MTRPVTFDDHGTTAVASRSQCARIQVTNRLASPDLAIASAAYR